MRSYSSVAGGPRAIVRDAATLLKGYYGSDESARVAALVERLRELEAVVREDTGLVLEGKRILDVGPGQHLNELVYFARRNDVVGIDLDVIVQGLDLFGYWRMLRSNGPERTVKTVGRKLALIDLRRRRELLAQLELPRPPRLDVREMNAEAMTFPDASFDFVYSISVFSHLPRPERVLDEIVRVLSPGGALYVNFLLYTSRTGAMDVRDVSGGNAELPLWAHLRPRHADEVVSSAYLNAIRLPEWRKLFSERLPGCRIRLAQPEREWLEADLHALRAEGELLDYADDELLTHVVTVVWKKP
jgi:SAM-dependent methyltransferase